MANSSGVPLARRDLSGEIFGRWTVLHPASRRYYWISECECGRQKEVYYSNLTGGRSRSCGCLASEVTSRRNVKLYTTHGMRFTAENLAWRSMKRRCLNPNAANYYLYGGRGISICKRWIDSFENFYADMGNKPSRAHSLDRIDVEGDYTPRNCRWASRQEQANNRRNNVRLDYNGTNLTVSEWARRIGLRPETLRERLRNGWTLERALTTPLNR